MKLSEFLTDVGRPIAYYPKLREITGSTNATIFLCQFLYWTGKGADPQGWIYKTSSEIEEETGLSYDEQATARKHLIKNGLIEERYARLEHQLYFRVLVDDLDWSWGNRKSGIPETGNAALGKQELPNSLIGTTENTTENTSNDIQNEKKSGEPTHPDLIIKAMFDSGMFPNGQTHDYLIVWREKHTDERILQAVQMGAGKNQKYIDSILVGWEANGYPKTREERIEAAKHKSNGQQDRPQRLPSGL